MIIISTCELDQPITHKLTVLKAVTFVEVDLQGLRTVGSLGERRFRACLYINGIESPKTEGYRVGDKGVSRPG